MKRSYLLPAAFMLDMAVGDPEWLPHPVRLIGFGIERGEILLRRQGRSAAFELLAGSALTVFVVAGTHRVTRAIVNVSPRFSLRFADAAEVLLAWTCLATRTFAMSRTR